MPITPGASETRRFNKKIAKGTSDGAAHSMVAARQRGCVWKRLGFEHVSQGREPVKEWIMISDLELVGRLLAGTAAGVAVGFERTRKQKSAGIRTFGLVGLGAAAATSIFVEPGQADAASRVVQGILTGIGFLGAGTIVMRQREIHPRGLTTAAAIWVTAALGCAAGRGDWAIVGTAVVVALLLLAVDHSIERWAGGDRPPEPEQAEPTATGENARVSSDER
ncbi:MgtC/SapB family protein [Bosea sp. (in: a-proteobacteria)]|uniref:MgtC/SapB family protein n=1 Tax=Bosea sp. (in: a-proteobacteria) TaxID=1871050 RepID=UPI002FC58185